MQAKWHKMLQESVHMFVSVRSKVVAVVGEQRVCLKI